MPTYISLVSWTEKGITNLKDSPKRLDAARAEWEKRGAKLKDFFLVMGEYDMITISEAPDDETAARAALALGASGSVRTQSFRAFTEDEYRKLIASV